MNTKKFSDCVKNTGH